MQEVVLPVLDIKKPEARAKKLAVRVKLTMGEKEMTNRLFVVRALYQCDELFGPETVLAKVFIMSEGKIVGGVAAAEYGFESTAGEVVLKKDKTNALTLVLTKEPARPMVDIILENAQTGALLDSIRNIPVKLSI